MPLFHSPHFLWLLILIPLVAWRRFTRHDETAVSFSSLDWASAMPRTLRQRLMWIPDALLLIALTLLIIALARPREGRDRTVTQSEGIAIELVVDRSGSMRAMDFRIDGERVDRLTAIKNVVGKFVLGSKAFGEDRSEDEAKLAGRFNDLVGLATFAGYADAVTPPTLDHGFLIASLNDTRIVDRRNEDGTAIGDAIALATEKLNALDARQDEKIKSKIIILLTDGESNAGSLEPVQAAELAAAIGIKVYTIGVGTRGEAPVPVIDPFSGRTVFQSMSVNIDEATLQRIAEITDAESFRATDTDSLEAIYAAIDELEKTKVETQQFVDYRELAVQPWLTGWIRLPPMLTLVLVTLVARILLGSLWLRELA
ncbi:VWA domain-containing protein [Neorhodopirellula pilleata]|uniref:von Willebrand factor type A domain protein n=1 Tax=Neorhodopirellula pilleata TaxID=2714738 RepID=A0A5C6AFY0_9BACT|nr:VWA domain-containing protein [Neorhodopirellula pilleata]TWT98874.1 von Willebrand factor type A domain protein [Neorhodopirellula pilleata]